jgi:hypothetical protein
VSETGKAEQSWPDEAVLEFANQDDRALLTLNRKHFVRLHNQGVEHAGIVACTVDPDFLGQAQRIDLAIRAVEGGLDGKLLRVNRPTNH